MTDLLGNPLHDAPSLFTPDFGKQPHAHVGRDGLLAELRRGLGAGPVDHRFTSLLLGPRGAGKTVTLNLIEDTAFEAGWIVLPLDASTAGIRERLNEIISWAHDRDETLNAGQGAFRQESQSFRLRLWTVEWQRTVARKIEPSWGIRRQLTTLAEQAAARGTAVLLTLDELHSGAREELRRLAADLQHITKRESKPLAFAGAGLSELKHTLLEDKTMTFFQRCTRFDMPPLTPADAMRCLSKTVRDAGGTIAGDALARLAAASGTLPYRMQLAGHHAWVISDAPHSPITETVAELAARETDRVMHEKVAAPTWHSLSDIERAVLRSVAEHGGSATRRQTAQLVPATSSTLAKAERHLVNVGCATAHDSVIAISGLMSLDDVQHLAALEAQYETVRDEPGAVSLVGWGLQRCNAPMPRAYARCILRANHKGRHRSR